MIILRSLYIGISIIVFLYITYGFLKKVIFPWIVDKRTVDIEKNPKWIISKLQDKYYGFNDIDIITVDSPLGWIPRFRLDKYKKDRLQLLISEDVSINDLDAIAQLALAGKIRIKYDLWYPEKPAHWLAILNFMLDGGDVNTEMTKLKEK